MRAKIIRALLTRGQAILRLTRTLLPIHPIPLKLLREKTHQQIPPQAMIPSPKHLKRTTQNHLRLGTTMMGSLAALRRVQVMNSKMTPTTLRPRLPRRRLRAPKGVVRRLRHLKSCQLTLRRLENSQVVTARALRRATPPRTRPLRPLTRKASLNLAAGRTMRLSRLRRLRKMMSNQRHRHRRPGMAWR